MRLTPRLDLGRLLSEGGATTDEIRAVRALVGAAGRPAFYGKYAGVVIDNEDPRKIGRLRARVPEVLGEEEASGWALPCAPWGGGHNRGFFALPEVGDTVWIEFEAGDPMRPIWSGTFWGAPDSAGGQDDLGKETGSEAPEGPGGPAGPRQYVFRTASGHLISLDDEGGVVVIAEAAGAEVRITADGEVIVTADRIKLGADAAEALVLGDAFQKLFNSHTHPTGVGPSGPPTQPMGATHLSSVAKTE
jgi:uncharacterized protein involved in type VI secretion and phage assembly